MASFSRLECIPPNSEDVAPLIVCEPAIQSALSKLNCRKATGPDGIPSWILKEYADILAPSISTILNSSFVKQRCPSSWKMADVVPIPKEKQITDVNKHLRPISLTPIISKLAENFVVSRYVGPAILEVIDPDHFGGIPRSSTLLALTSMVHQWAELLTGRTLL